MAGIRKMDVFEKKDFIKALGTAELIKSIHEREDELQELLKERISFRSESADYLTGKSSDCAAVKQVEAELSMSAPMNENGKKMGVDEKKIWLATQEKSNPALAEAIKKQKMAAFSSDDLDTRIEMAQTRLGNLKAILALRTAQITFFAGDVLVTINEGQE